MKLWIDAQLSPAIAAWINRTFGDIEAESVRALGLRDATDPEIFEKAKKAEKMLLKSAIKKVNKQTIFPGCQADLAVCFTM